MIEIIPAILEKNFNNVTKRFEEVVEHCSTVQIDVCDGVFVPSVSWPYSAPVLTPESKYYDESFKKIVAGEGEVDMPMWEELNFELDVMVADPKSLLKDLLSTGPTRMVFHAESFTDVYSEMYELFRKIPPLVEIGVSINVDTNPEILFKLIEEKIISFVQCMGIEKVGYQGQESDERVYKNLKVLREKFPQLPLSVDGAVNLKNAKQLVEAGATRLVAGSAVFANGDASTRVAEFKNLIQ